MVDGWIVAVVVIAVSFVVCVFLGSEKRIPPMNPSRKHFIITGGSSGIGLSTAILLAKQGANVTIIARDKQKLQQAEKLIKEAAASKSQRILWMSADTANAEEIAAAVKDAVSKNDGKIHGLITSAGLSRPGKIDEVPLECFDLHMRVNYLGTVYAIRAVLPYMKAQREGRLILVSSMAGLAGIVGFSCYSPTKFAVRGLAETLAMELRPYNIYVSLSVPPDVDTPMFREETQFKPIETVMISDGVLLKPEEVASAIVASLKSWKFMITNGVEGWMLATLTCGMSPPSRFSMIGLEIIGVGLMRFASLFYLWSWNRMVNKVHAGEARKKNRKESASTRKAE